MKINYSFLLLFLILSTGSLGEESTNKHEIINRELRRANDNTPAGHIVRDGRPVVNSGTAAPTSNDPFHLIPAGPTDFRVTISPDLGPGVKIASNVNPHLEDTKWHFPEVSGLSCGITVFARKSPEPQVISGSWSLSPMRSFLATPTTKCFSMFFSSGVAEGLQLGAIYYRSLGCCTKDVRRQSLSVGEMENGFGGKVTFSKP